MLVAIIIWAFLAFISLSYGVGVITLLRRFIPLPEVVPVTLTAVLFLGLVTSAWLSSILSIIVKTGLAAQSFVLIGALLIFIFQRNQIWFLVSTGFKRRRWMVWGLIVLVFFSTILYAVKVPINPDTQLYHAQAIRWIEEYPAIPGLGNLDPRLGANTNWFSLIALFSFSYLGLQSFHLVPSFLFIICLLFFLGGLQDLLEGDTRIHQIAKVGFIPLAFYVLIDEISSPGTDLPVILFYWVILCLWIESLEKGEASGLLQMIVFLLSVSVITFKLSGIMILLIAFQILWVLWRKKDYRSLFIYVGLAAVILIPWLLRTFIMTGYWLYPEPLMNLLSPAVDWKIPVQNVAAFKNGIQTWAFAPGEIRQTVSELPRIQRFAYWLTKRSVNEKIILFSALLFPVLYGLSWFLPRKDETRKKYAIVVVIGFLGLLFWLWTAPNFRFGYGFVLGMIVIVLSLPVRSLLERLGSRRRYVFAALLFALFVQQVHVILGSTRDGTPYLDYLVLPADYAHFPTDSCSLDGLTISCARKFRQCGYDAFPCVPEIPRNVELRGPSLQEGFRRESPAP